MVAVISMFGKKKKKKSPPERMESLKANGVEINALNFSIRKEEDGASLLVITPDVEEALHYDEVLFELRANGKLVKVKARFREASDEKRFKVYTFDVVGYEQYYV